MFLGEGERMQCETGALLDLVSFDLRVKYPSMRISDWLV